MSSASVTKMHGACNDFVVLDERSNPVPDLSRFARQVCDRRAGIGADGLIVLSASNAADIRMRIVNADGSEAEMCGNGIRCAARYLHELGQGDRFRIETLAGIVNAQVLEAEPRFMVRADIGKPHVQIQRADNGAAFVDVGNPHAVFFVSAIDDFDLAAAAKAMPEYNVHAAKIVNRGCIQVRHYERGAGETFACGTGAVACAVVAIERGWCDSPVDVRVPGGVLNVEWDGKNGAFLTGPAERVFETTVPIGDALLA